MNRKKLIILALFLAAFGFILRNTTVQNTPPPVGDDAFILGAMNNFEDANYSHISNPDEFGMNLWHHYSSSTYNSITDKHYLRGWFFGDTLFTTGNDYADSVKLILDTNEHHGMKTLLQRPKIEWLAEPVPHLMRESAERLPMRSRTEDEGVLTRQFCFDM